MAAASIYLCIGNLAFHAVCVQYGHFLDASSMLVITTVFMAGAADKLCVHCMMTPRTSLRHAAYWIVLIIGLVWSFSCAAICKAAGCGVDIYVVSLFVGIALCI